MTNKKKLLVLNGSHSELPLINAGKKLGYHVVTTGNKPELIGHLAADEYCYGDFSNKEEVLHIADSHQVSAICSSANDFGAISAAYVAQELGLPGHDSFETTLILHHKHRFKEFSESHSINTPRALCFDSYDDALAGLQCFEFPVMVKPVDLTGGKGVQKVCDHEQYKSALKNAFAMGRQNKIIVEDYFSGDLHSFSCFIINQRVHFYFSDNEYSFLNPFLVSSSAAPAKNVDKFAYRLVQEAEKVSSALNLVDGVLHFQYMANEEEFRVIEITRRCSGDLYPYPVSLATGIDWGEWIVMAEAGHDCSALPKVSQSGYCGRHCIMADRNGVVSSVEISKKIQPYVHQVVEWWKSGDVIEDYLTQKLGVLILKFPSLVEMEACSNDWGGLVKVHLD